MIARSRLW